MRSWSPRRPGPAGTGNARRVMLRPVLLCAHCVPPLHRGGTLRSSAAPRVRTPTQPVVFPHVHTLRSSAAPLRARRAHSRRLIGRRTPSAAPRVRTPAQPAVFPRVHTPVASSGGGCPPRRPRFGCRRSRPCSPVCTLPPPHGRGCPPRRPGFGRRRSRLCAPVCTLPSPHRAGGMPSATARVRMPAQPAVFPRVHTPAASWAGMPSAAPRVRTPAQPAVFPRVHTPVASSGGGMPLRDGPGSDAGAAGRVPPCAHSCVSVRFVSRLSVACCCRRPAGSSTFSRMSPCPARTFSSVPLTPPRATPSGRVAVSRNGSPSSSYGPFPAPAGRASGSPSTCRTAALACSPTATRIATFRGSWRRAVACKPRPASAVAASSIRVRTRATMSCLSMMIERVVDSRMTACTN